MTATFDPHSHPHRRLNPLTNDWVIVSPHRTQRPWEGQRDTSAAPASAVEHDSDCYLCPGNQRSTGATNPVYDTTFVFDNDFAALLPTVSSPHRAHSDELLIAEAAAGECRVICFSPRHDLTLSRMNRDETMAVIVLWQDQLGELQQRWEWVQIFETRGELSGSSNAHPHGQIWASDFIPDEARREIATQASYHSRTASPMLLDYARREADDGERTVAINDHWIAVVPYWAYWPYETLVLPRRPLASLLDVTADESDALAEVLSTMLRAFDQLFNTPFPYCSGWHTAPKSAAPGFQLHAHYYPPLLRSATIAKIPASYELLANLQRDLTPEAAASNLRAAAASRPAQVSTSTDRAGAGR